MPVTSRRLLPLALVLALSIAACSDDSELQPLPLAADPTARPTAQVIGPTPAPVATPDRSTPAPTPRSTAVVTLPSTPMPTSRSTPTPEPEPTLEPVEVYYANCSEVRAAGKAPLYRGQPGYRSGLDRDADGIACE